MAIFTILLLVIITSNFFLIPLINSQPSSRWPSKTDMGIGIPKVTNLHFYFYDRFSTPKPTAALIASAPSTKTSRTFFGGLVMIDDALLECPETNSKIVGRAQGMYASADLNNVAFLMVVNYVFTGNSKFNGSSLSVLGRNAVTQNTREMPIIGGTGAFRFAQGFAYASTKWGNSKGDAIVEYNVTVFHFESVK